MTSPKRHFRHNPEGDADSPSVIEETYVRAGRPGILPGPSRGLRTDVNFNVGRKETRTRPCLQVIISFQKLTSKPPERPVSSLSPVPSKNHPLGMEGFTLSGVFGKGKVDYSPVRLFVASGIGIPEARDLGIPLCQGIGTAHIKPSLLVAGCTRSWPRKRV